MQLQVEMLLKMLGLCQLKVWKAVRALREKLVPTRVTVEIRIAASVGNV